MLYVPSRFGSGANNSEIARARRLVAEAREALDAARGSLNIHVAANRVALREMVLEHLEASS